MPNRIKVYAGAVCGRCYTTATAGSDLEEFPDLWVQKRFSKALHLDRADVTVLCEDILKSFGRKVDLRDAVFMRAGPAGKVAPGGGFNLQVVFVIEER